MPIFEWTISVGNIATAIVFVVGIGVYLGDAGVSNSCA